MRKSWSIFSLAVAGMFMTACGGESAPSETPENSSQEAVAPKNAQEATEADSSIPDVIEVTIEGNDQMQYNLDKIEVYEGQTVKLTLKNVGVLPKDAMGHNWTLLAKGIDPLEYGNSVITMKDTEYQDPNRAADVIVHTAILGPGESETIEFEAPAKGIYNFVCTFPGHAGLMKGTFMVRGR